MAIDTEKLILLRDLMVNILVSAKIWRSLANEALLDLGLDSSIAACLFWIAHVGDGAKQIDIATEMGLTAASLVRMIDSLEALQLARREVDENNRRANRIRLTEEGHRVVSIMQKLLDGVHQKLFREFENTDINMANNLLRRVISERA
jgi:MarR family transcriptional regulator, transcriptional regulator for hemolysin